ncbi:unnamed protein product [Rodentolepis nana]|uniref:MIF4G domain-containing protein n=1 Tax=Rodentolepis nana TaxID=102285 RepID=A0A0R3T648_RODNA|nr:unnamed protein product [Rodentolepis nana]
MDCDQTPNDPLVRPEDLGIFQGHCTIPSPIDLYLKYYLFAIAVSISTFFAKVVKGIKNRLQDSVNRTSNSDSADMNISYQSISPPLENVRFPSRHGSSLQVASSASSSTSKSTSIKTSKTVASSSMTTMDSIKTLSVRSTSSKSSFSESKTSSSNRLIDSSSKLVENIAEMQNLFQQNNVSESMLDQIENRCQSLETYLPQWKSNLISPTSTEIGCRFKEVKKRTNLAYLRLLRQLVNEVGLDAALSGSIGIPILEAFCSRPLSNIIIDQSSRSTPGGDSTEGPDGLTGRVNGRSENENNPIPARNKLRHAVRLLMAKGKDAAEDRDLNSEFMALIESEF